MAVAQNVPTAFKAMAFRYFACSAKWTQAGAYPPDTQIMRAAKNSSGCKQTYPGVRLLMHLLMGTNIFNTRLK